MTESNRDVLRRAVKKAGSDLAASQIVDINNGLEGAEIT